MASWQAGIRSIRKVARQGKFLSESLRQSRATSGNLATLWKDNFPPPYYICPAASLKHLSSPSDPRGSFSIPLASPGPPGWPAPPPRLLGSARAHFVSSFSHLTAAGFGRRTDATDMTTIIRPRPLFLRHARNLHGAPLTF